MRATHRLGLVLVPLSLATALIGIFLLVSALVSGPALGRDSDPPQPCDDPQMKSPGCAGLVELHVKDVIPIEEAHTNALVLVSNDGTVLPVFVARPEALNIAFRLAHRVPPHGLAQDLLDEVVEGLGGKVTEVRIQSVHDDDVQSRIIIKQGQHYIGVKGRPSDAVSMALSEGAHIYVTRTLLKKDGITRKEIEDMRRQMGIGGSGSQPSAPPGQTQPPPPPPTHPKSGEIKM